MRKNICGVPECDIRSSDDDDQCLQVDVKLGFTMKEALWSYSSD